MVLLLQNECAFTAAHIFTLGFVGVGGLSGVWGSGEKAQSFIDFVKIFFKLRRT